LDEPTLGLDILSQAALREYVREYVRRTGAACIVTSHYMRDIEDLAQRALLLDRGEIVAEGSPGELARRFSGARVLRVVFEQEVPEGELRRLGELEEFNGNEAVILVPAAKTKEAAQTLLECFSVHDLTIEEPDLEEALRTYFREAG
jgi:ABC-2 type transport system ATP-binding protein